MTSPWHTFFKAFPPCCLLAILPATELAAGTVTGKVELRDSRDPAVRNHHDYSSVVISLTPVHGDVAMPLNQKHATILQKNKGFSPHVLAIPVGSFVDFP